MAGLRLNAQPISHSCGFAEIGLQSAAIDAHLRSAKPAPKFPGLSSTKWDLKLGFHRDCQATRKRTVSASVHSDPSSSSSSSPVSSEPDLSVVVNGLRLPNPFVIGSGPPGTNYTVMKKAFDEGWGAVIAKTVKRS
jgi:hypothetical protein